MPIDPDPHNAWPTEPETETGPTPTAAPNGNETPDAVQEATTGPRRTTTTRERPRGRGVEWVRPADLIAHQTSRLAGRGIDFHAELARRARAPVATGGRRIGDRARRLPPVHAFGRRGTARQGPARSGVGMS